MSKVIKLDYADTHRNIVEKCKRGNRQAQFELYRLYSKAMYNICLRMVKSKLDAEDILQNSFVDIFSKLHTFKFQSSVGAWIKRIVINNCINHLKKKKIYFDDLDPRHANILDEPMVEDEKTER
jgi:RNA polymerase sigma factor (sigma-70 family)